MKMGFAGDLGAEFTGYSTKFLMQIASGVTSVFMRMFGRKLKELEPPFEARNPPANKQILRPIPRGVFFGARGGQYIVKSEEMDGHVLVVGILTGFV